MAAVFDRGMERYLNSVLPKESALFDAEKWRSMRKPRTDSPTIVLELA